MQENEFEKKIRQELESLRLRPDHEIWDKVAADLKKKRRRPVTFWLFLMAGLSLAGSAGYFLWENINQNKSEVTILKQPDQTLIGPGSENTFEKSKEKITEIQEPKQSITGKAVDKNKNIPESDISLTQKNKEAKGKLTSKDFGINPGSTLNTSKAKNETRNWQESKNKINSISENEIVVKEKNTGNQKQEQLFPDAMIIGAKQDRNEKVANDKEEELTHLQNPVLEKIKRLSPDSAVIRKNTVHGVKNKSEEPETADGNKKNVAIQKLMPSLRWGIQFSAGTSNLGTGFFALGSLQKNADLFTNTPGNNPNTGTPSGVVFNPPSSSKAGFAFTAGVVAEKRLTRKSSIAAGLHYSYRSNSIKTGIIKDTIISIYDRNTAQSFNVNEVYSGKQKKEFTNRFHFIQIPVYYQWQINKGKKLPILWNTGLSGGYLVASNALLYDTSAGGIYYRNKKAYNKIQVGIHSGFLFRLGGSKIQWAAGPEFSVAARSLLKSDLQQKQYFLFCGVTGRLFFTNKK